MTRQDHDFLGAEGFIPEDFWRVAAPHRGEADLDRIKLLVLWSEIVSLIPANIDRCSKDRRRNTNTAASGWQNLYVAQRSPREDFNFTGSFHVNVEPEFMRFKYERLNQLSTKFKWFVTFSWKKEAIYHQRYIEMSTHSSYTQLPKKSSQNSWMAPWWLTAV